MNTYPLAPGATHTPPKSPATDDRVVVRSARPELYVHLKCRVMALARRALPRTGTKGSRRVGSAGLSLITDAPRSETAAVTQGAADSGAPRRRTSARLH